MWNSNVKLFISISVLLFFGSCNSQSKKTNTDKDAVPIEEIVYESNMLDQPAVLSGCEQSENKSNCTNNKLLDYVFKRVEFLHSENMSESLILVSFVIEKDGSIAEIQPLKAKYEFERTNIRKVLEEMPKWIPAQKNNEVVRARYKLPIRIHWD